MNVDDIAAELSQLRHARKHGVFPFHLWDTYRNSPPSTPLAARIYKRLAERLLSIMATRSIKCRSWTNYRIAAAMLEEIIAGMACPLCRDQGCDACSGTGIKRWSDGNRASACGCHKADFKMRLSGMYQEVFLALGQAMKKSRALHSHCAVETGTVGTAAVEPATNPPS